MKDILKNLYNGFLNESERSRKRTETDEKMDGAYEAMYKTLTEEQKRLFEEFYFYSGGVLGEQEEEAYVRGFKTGAWLVFELFDFSPRYDG